MISVWSWNPEVLESSWIKTLLVLCDMTRQMDLVHTSGESCALADLVNTRVIERRSEMNWGTITV